MHDLRTPPHDLPRVDWVFHLAGGYAGAGYKDLQESDLVPARNVLDWGSAAGVRNWVLASAAEVYGAVERIATEQTATEPVIPYGRIKLGVERLFTDFEARAPGSRVVILRIGEVYGRTGRLVEELRRRLNTGWCSWFGSGQVRVSFVHVDDVARAFVAAANGASGGVNIWNVADDEPATWRDFLRSASSLLGRRPPVALPLTLARLYAAGSCAADKMAGRPPVLTTHTVRLLTTPKPLSNAKLKREAGFGLLYPDYRDGLKEVFRAVPHDAQDG